MDGARALVAQVTCRLWPELVNWIRAPRLRPALIGPLAAGRAKCRLVGPVGQLGAPLNRRHHFPLVSAARACHFRAQPAGRPPDASSSFRRPAYLSASAELALAALMMAQFGRGGPKKRLAADWTGLRWTGRSSSHVRRRGRRRLH